MNFLNQENRVAAIPSWWKKLFKFQFASRVSRFKHFWIWLLTHRQSCEVQKQAWSAVVLQVSYLIWLKKTKIARENRFSQLHGPGIIVLQIHNDLKSTPPNFQKGKIEIFVLPASLGNTGHLKKGEGKRFLTRPTPEFSPIKRVAVYLNIKISTMSFEKYLQ
jgi:hypothetical protein